MKSVVTCSIPLSIYLVINEVSLTQQFGTDLAKLIAQRLSMLIALFVLFYRLSLYLCGTQTKINHAK